jgi:hypothetical protein
MTYLITYETEGVNAYPKSIIIHDIPQWIKDNPKAYITVCTPLSDNTIKLSKRDLVNTLNKR